MYTNKFMLVLLYVSHCLAMQFVQKPFSGNCKSCPEQLALALNNHDSTFNNIPCASKLDKCLGCIKCITKHVNLPAKQLLNVFKLLLLETHLHEQSLSNAWLMFDEDLEGHIILWTMVFNGVEIRDYTPPKMHNHYLASHLLEQLHLISKSQAIKESLKIYDASTKAKKYYIGIFLNPKNIGKDILKYVQAPHKNNVDPIRIQSWKKYLQSNIIVPKPKLSHYKDSVLIEGVVISKTERKDFISLLLVRAKLFDEEYGAFQLISFLAGSKRVETLSKLREFAQLLNITTLAKLITTIIVENETYMIMK